MLRMENESIGPGAKILDKDAFSQVCVVLLWVAGGGQHDAASLSLLKISTRTQALRFRPQWLLEQDSSWYV